MLREAETLRDDLAAWQGLLSRASDLAELAELASEAGDDSMTAGVDAEYQRPGWRLRAAAADAAVLG